MKTRVQKVYPIYNQNGQNRYMYPMYDQNDWKPYPLGLRMPIWHV